MGKLMLTTKIICTQCKNEVTEKQLGLNRQICQQCENSNEFDEAMWWRTMRDLGECDDLEDEFWEE